MDRAQFLDDRVLLLILALLVSVLLLITSSLVTAGTCAAAKIQGRPLRLWTKAFVNVAG